MAEYHMISSVWSLLGEPGEKGRSGGCLGRKSERITIKYVQLSEKISIC